MFESLSDRLAGVFDKLRGRGALSEDEVRSAMREVRVALLEADVALPVARDFVDRVFDGALDRVMVALLDSKSPTPDEFDRLRAMIDEAQRQSTEKAALAGDRPPADAQLQGANVKMGPEVVIRTMANPWS